MAFTKPSSMVALASTAASAVTPALPKQHTAAAAVAGALRVVSREQRRFKATAPCRQCICLGEGGRFVSGILQDSEEIVVVGSRRFFPTLDFLLDPFLLHSYCMFPNVKENAQPAAVGGAGAAAGAASSKAWATSAQPLTQRTEKEYDHSFVGMTGGEIFHEMMLRHGVEKVFGYPGGAILPVFDAIYNSSYFDFILPRHEQGAGHMAEAYARVAGKPGVVLVTSGPGATNIITPLQDALSDGVPLIVFSGQVPTSAIGSDGFQEADIVGISRSCTKWNVMVKDIAELPRRISEAFEIATSGRPGPVLVDLPKDVTGGVLNRAIPTVRPFLPSRPMPESIGRSGANDAARNHQEALQRVAELCNGAKKPVIYAGHGILSSPGGWKLLREFADKANIPVTTTLLGLGAFDELDPKSLHMLGMHGSVYANLSIQSADLVLALGARFDDRVTGNLR
ncbi:Acetolactate synthase, mitochondrial, partial [Coemansia sp. BCRC 34490]